VKKTAADETAVQDAMLGAEDVRQEQRMEDVAMPVSKSTKAAGDVNVEAMPPAGTAPEIDAEVDEVI